MASVVVVGSVTSCWGGGHAFIFKPKHACRHTVVTVADPNYRAKVKPSLYPEIVTSFPCIVSSYQEQGLVFIISRRSSVLARLERKSGGKVVGWVTFVIQRAIPKCQSTTGCQLKYAVWTRPRTPFQCALRCDARAGGAGA